MLTQCTGFKYFNRMFDYAKSFNTVVTEPSCGTCVDSTQYNSVIDTVIQKTMKMGRY